uniref:Uncharacterized protein n=1 Tax=Timema monikensis TaxID=170555 RepID=A0A7R9EC79_9NEOP|nr:unnamed protein product [Timema monikensis]
MCLAAVTSDRRHLGIYLNVVCQKSAVNRQSAPKKPQGYCSSTEPRVYCHKMMPNQSKFETEHDSDSDSNADSYSSDCKPHNRNSSNEEDGEESSCDKWENETYPSAMTDYVRELVASRKECEQYSDYESLMPEQLSVPLTNTSFLTDYYEKVQEHHPSYLRSPSDLHYDNYPKVCEEPTHSDDNKYLISPNDPYDMYSRSSNQPDYSKVHDAMAQDRVSSPTKSCLSDDLNSTPCQNTLSTDEDSCKDDSQSMKHEDCSIQDVGNKPMDIIDDKNNFVSISSPENKPDARIDTAFKVELGLLKANYMCSQDTNFVKMKPNNSSSKQDIFEGKKPNSPPPEVIFEGAILNVKRPTKTNNEQTYFEEKNDQTLIESTSSPSPINNELLPLSEFVDIKTALTPIKIKNESCNSHKNMTTTDNSLLYDRDTKPDIKPMMCVDEKPRQRRKYVKKKCIETTEVSEYRKKLRSWVRREHCLSTGLPEKQSTVKQEHILTTKQETKFRSNIKLKREVIEQQGLQQQLNVKQEHILTTKQETKFRSNIKPKREVIEQQGLQQQSTVKQEHILTTKQETKFRSNIKLKREVIEQQGLQQQLNVKQEHILTTKQETKFRSNIKPKREVIEQQGLRRSARIKSALEKRYNRAVLRKCENWGNCSPPPDVALGYRVCAAIVFGTHTASAATSLAGSTDVRALDTAQEAKIADQVGDDGLVDEPQNWTDGVGRKTPPTDGGWTVGEVIVQLRVGRQSDGTNVGCKQEIDRMSFPNLEGNGSRQEDEGDVVHQSPAVPSRMDDNLTAVSDDLRALYLTDVVCTQNHFDTVHQTKPETRAVNPLATS